MKSLMEEAQDYFSNIDHEKQAEFKEIRQEATKDRKWGPLPGPQTEAFKSLADELLYGGQAGPGKGLRPEEPILTPFGWRAVGKLKVGDAVCATDGSVTHVIGAYQRGEQPLYRLIFSDGAEIECDADHVWLAWENRGYRRGSGEIISGRASAKKWTTSQIAEHYESGRRKLSIPCLDAPPAFNVAGSLVGPSNFQGRTIPPYVLGALLGDGYLGKKGVLFSSADPEIAERIEAELGVTLSRYSTQGAATSYRIPNDACIVGLASLDLIGKKSDTKFIPRVYLLAPVEDRWALLQGLMDTDGWAEDTACYATVSERLRDDVAHLARSLGALVSISKKTPTYTHKGEKRTGKAAYTLRIKFADYSKVFHLKRKRVTQVPQSMGRKIVSIEPAGRGRTVCIEVSHPNSLYITNHFLVTHNTDLLLGLAFEAHHTSLIMRRQYTDMGALTRRAIKINGTRDGYSGKMPMTLVPKGTDKLIEFGAAARPGDEMHWQGQPHDFFGADEVVGFLEEQIRLLMGWVRSEIEGQRQRVVLASNPPITADGFWIIPMYAPWLDLTYPNPAEKGELRWVLTDPDGNDLWVDGPDDGREWNGQTYMPVSRTFIAGTLADNPYLVRTDYGRRLDQLPEPMRSAFRDGNFMAAREDAADQCIPTAWVLEAQNRWRSDAPEGIPMTGMGVDCSGGGQDPMIIAMRHDGWYAPMLEIPAKDIPDDNIGRFTAGVIVANRRQEATVILDMGGGYGGSTFEHLKDNRIDPIPYKGAEKSVHRTADRQLGFTNKRSQAIWQFREALDPNQDGGSPIALPKDQQLLADLTAPTFEVAPNGIKVEPKKKVCERLGRSTDKGDATVMAWYGGDKFLYKTKGAYGTPGFGRGKKPEVVTGRKKRDMERKMARSHRRR